VVVMVAGFDVEALDDRTALPRPIHEAQYLHLVAVRWPKLIEEQVGQVLMVARYEHLTLPKGVFGVRQLAPKDRLANEVREIIATRNVVQQKNAMRHTTIERGVRSRDQLVLGDEHRHRGLRLLAARKLTQPSAVLIAES